MLNLAGERRGVAAAENWKLKKTVVLVGMMGAGKTAVGKALVEVPILQEHWRFNKITGYTKTNSDKKCENVSKNHMCLCQLIF